MMCHQYANDPQLYLSFLPHSKVDIETLELLKSDCNLDEVEKAEIKSGQDRYSPDLEIHDVLY